MKSVAVFQVEEILRSHGYRITPHRVALLSFLRQAKNPLSLALLQKAVPTMDRVTLFRALTDFTESKIITKINLHDRVTYYEFVHHGHHHHHVVCEVCGKIEDIEHCHQSHIEQEVLHSSKKFKTITSHSLEFFGICKDCSRR